MRHVAYWWIFFWAQVAACALAAYLGVFTKVLHADVTYLSFVILLLNFCGGAWIGRQTFCLVTQARGMDLRAHNGWFLAEAAMLLGLAGTVGGFIYTLDTTLGLQGLDLARIKEITAELGRGLSTSGYTTFFGIMTALSLKLQMNNLQNASHG